MNQPSLPFASNLIGPEPKIEAKHVNAILGELAEKPGAAKKLRHRLRQIMQHAVDLGWRTDNPVLVSKKIKHRSDGFVPWTEEEIAKFEAHWPSGSKPRLALSLLLYTGQRRSDMVRMGQQHVTGSRISVVQVKTGARLMIPIHPALKVEIAQHKDDMTFLRTEYGKPFSVAGFGDWFKDKVTKAEIEGRTAHGLRKAAGRRLAEAGCTAHEIMSILGHVSLNEAQKYTRDVDQQRMADGAIRKLRGTKKERVVSNPSVKP
jgi:integrase